MGGSQRKGGWDLVGAQMLKSDQTSGFGENLKKGRVAEKGG